MHQSEKDLIAKKANGNKDEEKRLTQAACYEVKCWEQYPEGSQEREINYVGVMDAYTLKDELTWIKLQQTEGQFGYSAMDSITDRMLSEDIPVAKNVGKVATGGLTAYVGATICGTTGIGCLAGGGWMIGAGTSTAIDGGTGLYNQYNGRGTTGIDPLRHGFNQVLPQGWGDIAYDGMNLVFSIGALKAHVPLKVGASDGINRTSSLFGVKVPRVGNATLNPLTGMPLPYGITQGTLLFGIGSNGLEVINQIHNSKE